MVEKQTKEAEGKEVPLHASPASLLRTVLSDIQRRNPQFSLRALARRVDFSPGRLSELMKQDGHLGPDPARRLLERLGWEERKISAQLEHWEVRKRHLSRLPRTSSSYETVEESRLMLLREWHHFAVVNLLKLGVRTSDEMAERLGLPLERVEESLRLLEEVGVLTCAADLSGFDDRNLTTSVDVPSSIIRGMHRSLLRKAEASLEEVDVMRRDFSSIQVPGDPKRLALAKEMIQGLRRSVAELFEADLKNHCATSEHEVFCLNIQLFPLTCSLKGRK